MIHRFIPGSNGFPTLLLLHGTGGNEDDLIPLGKSIAPDASLLSPRGEVLERGMPRFFRRLAEGVFDEADLVRRTADLAAFVRSAADTHHFDEGAVVALGYSNGANIAASMLLLHPGVLHAAALMHPMVPLTPERLPQLASTRVVITAGGNDPIVPAANTERLAAMLREAGATVEVHWAHAGHSIAPEELDAVRKWFAEIT
ncbi:MAG: alpha/beta hydrolase [Anaerolineae bacterium]|nr:alpha/beta hydrolase [Gemmatimonadaceae bacterium]